VHCNHQGEPDWSTAFPRVLAREQGVRSAGSEKGRTGEKIHFGHYSKPVKSALRGRGRAIIRERGGLRGVCRGAAGEAKGGGQFDGGRGCGTSRSGRGRAALRELVGIDSTSNFTPLTNSRKNSDDKSSPSPITDPISNTSVSATAKAVETIVVDLSSDSEASSPSSRSSSPSSSWTTSPSPDEEQDDMMVHPGLELLRTCSPLASLWQTGNGISPLICPEMGSSVREVRSRLRLSTQTPRYPSPSSPLQVTHSVWLGEQGRDEDAAHRLLIRSPSDRLPDSVQLAGSRNQAPLLVSVVGGSDPVFVSLEEVNLPSYYRHI